MHKVEKTAMPRWTEAALRVFAGSVIALSGSVLFLLPAAAGLSLGKLPEHWMDRLTALCCALGAFLGGAAAEERTGRRRLLRGAAVGLGAYALLRLVGAIIFGASQLGCEALVPLAACLCGGTLSGLLPGKKQKRTGVGRRGKKR